MTVQPVDGGPNYYGNFSNGLPTSASYFPIGVWFESVLGQGDVNLDKDAGLNLYVVLTEDSNIPLVQSNGMKAILQGRGEFPASTPTQGWFLADEVDMTDGPGPGYTTMQSIADAAPRDGRVRYANYGKGVLFWDSDQQAAQFVNSYQDIVSADEYWFTDNNVCSAWEGGVLLNGSAALSSAQCHRAANYGATVRRVRSLESPAGSKPVWAYVELGHPFTDYNWPTITPAQVRAAVWQSLIGGARAIIYFNHSFGGPSPSYHILRAGAQSGSVYAPIRTMVKSVNQQITSLAPALNAPTVTSGWSQGAGTTAMVKWVPGGTAAVRSEVLQGSATKSAHRKRRRAKARCEAKRRKCEKRRRAAKRRPAGLRQLTVGLAGQGKGSVTGPGINCPDVCTNSYASGTSVSLVATPAAGSQFTGWSGACSGTGPCSVTMKGARTVTATFTAQSAPPPPTPPTYPLNVTATGGGSVTGPGIACPGDCTESYAGGTQVTLTAGATTGNSFTGWGGACTGTSATCVVTMDAAKSVSAGFATDPPPPAATGSIYVFAGSAGSATTGSFSLPCVGTTTATVVGEGRTLPVAGGSFTDNFADANSIHIYRIDGVGSACGLPAA